MTTYNLTDIVDSVQYGFNYHRDSQNDGKGVPIGNTMQWLMYQKGLTEVPLEFREMIKRKEDFDDSYPTKAGWEFTTMGAEGPYYEKGNYRLQIIQQNELDPSVHNMNYSIAGVQNLHIFMKETFGTLFFGYCNGIEDFEKICDFIKLKF